MKQGLLSEHAPVVRGETVLRCHSPPSRIKTAMRKKPTSTHWSNAPMRVGY